MRRSLSLLALGAVSLLALVLDAAPRQAQAALPPPVLTTPAPGATLAVMEVTVAWGLPQGSTQFHLQVIPANNDGPAVSLIRDAAGWFTIPAPPAWYGLLPDMTYSWRVRATDKPSFAPEGDPSWGAWSETRTFRTPAASSEDIQAVSPANAAVVAGTGPVALRWSHPSPAVFYFEVQVSGDSRFDTDPASATSFVWWNLVHGGVTSPPNSWQTPALETGTTYYWRVRPRVQGDGTPVPWSSVFRFQSSDTGGGPGTGGAGILSHRWFPADLAGFVHVVGEVANNTGADIFAPRVALSFFLSDGRPAGTFSSYATLSRLGPGQRAGFRFLEDPQPGWSRYDLSLSYSATPTGEFFRPLVRSVTSSVDGRGVLHIVGEVVNDSGANLRATKVAITLYDGQGRLMNVDSAYTTPEELNAGAVGSFDVAFPKEYQGYVNAAIMAEGQRR